MKQIQLLKMFKIKSKFKAANKSENRSCNNILKQNFHLKGPNKACFILW